MSWAWMIVSDHDSALRQASVALKELRRQDEPYWTAVAVLTVGYIERDAGRYDDAFGHLSEAHELAERLGYSWLDTYTRVLLGTDRFDQLYAAGARLSRREAAAAATRDQRTDTPAS
jgi:hypothetical protein